uniref:Polycystic kidney disease 1 like 2a n=1 Tax=Cyclopterus lumpus TaxID=8103 RepID=A0A8C3A6T3_CYCLU
MESTVFPTLTLMVLFLTCSAQEDAEALSCPEYQEGFDGSCYEFVGLQRSFLSAQGWCERGAGHLAFILNDETQQFLQKHLDPEKDWWLGLAPAAPNLTLDSAATEGSLAWLEGSDVSYSNWLNTPDAQAACGYILRHSGFQWEAAGNCSQELNFICQYDSGRSIACDGQNATLQCGSGQVVEIDDSFYGRKTIHYCRSKLTASPTSSQEECSWIDVMDSVKAHCHSLQACQAPVDLSSFGEPCPLLGSYLSVEYTCKHGLHLLMSKLAAVFDNVTITVKWLLNPFQGNLTCTLNAGDGHIIDPYSPAKMESTMMHKFTRPGVFMVGVECTTSDWHVTAQKLITIQQPVGDFGVIKCYSRNMSTGGTKCNMLHGRPVEIQVMVEAGTNVSYTIQHEGHLVANVSVENGIEPHNITLSGSVVEKLGHGCHNLTLTASNRVTAHAVSTDLKLCLLEPIEGLQASVRAEEDVCPDSTDLTIGVSLERGAPAELLFTLTGASDALSENRDMLNGSLQAYIFSSPLEGSYGSSCALRLSCVTTCPDVVWYIEDPKPLRQDGNTEYVVHSQQLKVSRDVLHNISVIAYGAFSSYSHDVLFSNAYTFPIPGPEPTKPAATEVPADTRPPSCSISPPSGTVLDAFDITCKTSSFCSTGCLYCFKTDTGENINANEVKSVFLPLGDKNNNYSLSVVVTVKNEYGNTNTTVSTQVCHLSEEAGSLLVDLSSSLNTISVNQDDGDEGEVVQAATPIVEAASNILNVSSNVRTEISLILNVQSALLNNKMLDGDPAIIDSGQISVVSPKKMQMQDVNVQKNSSSRFSFPALPAHIVSPEEPVDVRMMSFEKNPYSWKEENITGTVGSISLTRVNGTVISVENLPNEIEIFLPRLDVGQENSTVLDLANFSTLIINVPSPDVTLVLKMEPSENISFMLFLGCKDYPNDDNYVAKTQMPLENAKGEEKYTWVLSPKDRTGEVGEHYLVMKPIVEPGIKSMNATVTVISIAAQCKYWNETESSWSENGCRVGPLTTTLVTHCLCNHLTFFGSSFFVMPNLVDVSRTAELFATFTNNPVVVCFVGSIFAAYLLVIIWARRKDIQDSAKVKITVLEDNDPLAEYHYMLNISTGHRRGASTSSQVTITLLGTEGESEPHHLTDTEKPVFERGGVDMFLLTTHFSLGDLQSIRLWHDNSGAHPAWYVNKVMVQDLESGQKWHFLCNSWLAVDVGECALDKVFPVATEMDLKRFSNLFFMKTAKDFRDGHIWFSVISRPPCSTFTRVQRVSCCFSLLLCTMLTSIMFWGIPTDPSEQTMDLGHIEFTWQQVVIGVQSSIIMFPINLLIVSIFRNSRPREKGAKTDTCKQGKTGRVSPSQTSSPQKTLKDITPDTVIKDIKRIAQSLSKAMKSPLPHLELRPGQPADINTLLSLVEDIIRQQNRAAGDFYTDASKRDPSMILSLHAVNLEHDDVQKKSNNSRYLYKQLRHVEKGLGLLGLSRFPNPDSYNRAMQQVQGMKGLLEYHLHSSNLEGAQLDRSPSPEESVNEESTKKCCQGGLPWWFVFVGWILVIATSGVSGYFTMMYGLTYGKDRSISWLISMMVSFFESLFITQPLKVLGFAAFFALVLKKVDQEEYGEPQIDESLRNTDDPDTVRAARRDSTCSFYQPPPPTDIEKIRNRMIKEQKVFALIREILAYMGFMWMLLLVAYGQRDPNAYFLTQHIRQSFSRGISDSMSIQDMINWANATLLSNVFGEHQGFITDGNSRLVGNARLRQVRVQPNSCHVAPSMQQSERDCHAPYSWELEDMGSYGPGWSRSEGHNTSLNLQSPWTYQSQHQLRAFPIWGSVKLYRGGGFVVDLGPDLHNSSRSVQYLYDNTWFDVYTQAVFVEFTVYNANVNLFCIVTLMLETTAIGAFQFRSELQSVRLYQSTGGLHIFVMASEAIYFLFIIYYMFVQGKMMKQQRWAYFKSKLNLLELAIIILSWSALSVFIKRTLLGQRDIEYYQNNKDQYASFHETAKADAVLGYLIAFLVLLATVKLWHLLRLNPKLHMITATLQRAWTDISGFLVVMTIMFLAYSIASNLMYGWKLYSYRTLLNAAQTMVSLQLGIFNYEEVLNYNPVLGAFLIGSCIVFMTFVVLNLFISVILVAFSQEQIHHKPSEEDEIVDLMLMKVFSLFGLKCKKQAGDCPTERPVGSSASNTGPSTISSENIIDG